MTIEEIMRLRDGGEQTNVQFKERITRKSKSEIAGEMVALSNTHGVSVPRNKLLFNNGIYHP